MMISSLIAMQNAISARNYAQMQMMQNSDRMLSNISFGNSQPLRPSFTGDSFELQNKVSETRISALLQRMDAFEKYLGEKIKKSVPSYTGIDTKK